MLSLGNNLDGCQVPHLLIKLMQFERIMFLATILLESEGSLMFFSYVFS